ncbi:hypothetical protein ES708_26175 [subsurface metagenome]
MLHSQDFKLFVEFLFPFANIEALMFGILNFLQRSF